MPNKIKKSDKNEIAISVKNVSKTFRIPHEKITSLRGAAVSVFKKNSYEEFKALDDVSFEVKKGEFFGIIGRNGSGKSTLLKILAGIYQADKVHPVKSAKGSAKQFNRGTVKVNGMISPFLELGIGFNPELSGRDNVYLNATVLGMTKKQIDEKFDSIVKFSELERFIDQKLKNYSSGMSVRLAFSVSIHANRDILLMDEVLAVGDSNFQSKCLEEFNKYRDMGRTVIIVTHDISVVERYCDRAMLLRNGKIIKIGKADKVVNEYIQGNIEDEEKRFSNLKDEADTKSATIVSNEKKVKKAVEIGKVEFLDKDGEIKNVFETGDDMTIRVYFNQNREIEDFNFGIAILSQEDVFLFGIATDLDNVDAKKYSSNGFFEVIYKNIPLKTGNYYMNIVINSEVGGIVFDYMEKAKKFKVFSNDLNTGMIKFDYEWN